MQGPSAKYVSPALFVSVVVIATSGLVYELVAGTIASYVLGDSVSQFSFVIGLYLFAMGVGSYLTRHIEGSLLQRFVEIELGVAMVGGLSAPILFAVYTARGAFQPVLYGVVFIIGTLVGLEIPILIRLLKFRLSLKDLVARVLALDYIGALLASLLFPLAMLPLLGVHRTSLLFGILNALVALVGTFLLPLDRSLRFQLRGQCVVVITMLGVAMASVNAGVLKAESTYFGAPIVHAQQTPYQRIVITRSRHTTRLFLNGNLQFSSDDERRYHETLVHPAVAALGRQPKRVLILGGGDGLAVRELLRYSELESVTLVDLDPAMTELFQALPLGLKLNEGALNDPRVTVLNQDAFRFLDETKESFDLAIVDFPDPSNYALGKLYTLSFYQRLRQRVGVNGVAVIQSTSPFFARQSYWTIAETLEAADFRVHAMHCYVPSFGEWGFLLAGGPSMPQPKTLQPMAGQLSFLNEQTLAQLFVFPPDMARVEAQINRLNHQPLVKLYAQEWSRWAP